MREWIADYETLGPDLPQLGARKYSLDPRTGIYSLHYFAFDEGPSKLRRWVAADGPPPEELREAILAGDIFYFRNADFDRMIFENIMCGDYGLPLPDRAQFRCTAAWSQAHGLRGSLEESARALGIEVRKNKEGTRLINTYSAQCVPWQEIPPEDQQLFLAYGDQDVLLDWAVIQNFRPLTDYEWREYEINCEINDRGVPVDLELAMAAVAYADEVRADADHQVMVLTQGQVPNTRVRKTRDEWIEPLLTEEHREVLEAKGKLSFAQDKRDSLLEVDDVHPDVRRYLELLDAAGGATIAKYSAMVGKEIDGRVHDVIKFNGAGQTGRFSSHGIQLHNLRRDSYEDPEEVEEHIAVVLEHGAFRHESVTTVLSRLVRSAIRNDETGLAWFDFSGIEGRVCPWLANSAAGERKLDVFRRGEDPYLHAAAGIFHRTYADLAGQDGGKPPERQIGKVAELALQFLGGPGALHSMGPNYGVRFADEEAVRVRDGWRAANPWAKTYGKQLETAVRTALRHPETPVEAGRVLYQYDGRMWLWCRLPSGRLLAYYRPELVLTTTPWGEEQVVVETLWGSRRPKAGEPWTRRKMHGGIWLENITQAVAADLLREAIVRCNDADLPIVLHVHDELIVEGRDVDTLGRLMLEAPDWAEGLPLEGAGGTGNRYGK
jgi:DNA polymerase